ncbi:MAG: hypothetical protein ACREP9_03480 [Candidatus Dormibacteraceae bacterium]
MNLPHQAQKVGVIVAAAVAFGLFSPLVEAASAPLSNPAVLTQLDIAKGQQPENIALEPDGSADLTFGFNGQVARINRSGDVQVTDQLPVPTNGDVPGSHSKIFLGGIVRIADGTRYVAVSTGTAQGTGVYRLQSGHQPSRIAALPSTSFLNGMALDKSSGELYIADSVQSTVWRVSLRGGNPSAWATDKALAPISAPPPAGGFGADGLKIHHDSVWVSNISTGTLLRIPISPNGTAGTTRTMITGLGPIDDFAFTKFNHEPVILAAINPDNRVVLIKPDRSVSTVLTAADGLSNPTSVAIRNSTVYVTNGAYFNKHDPSLLTAQLDKLI